MFDDLSSCAYFKATSTQSSRTGKVLGFECWFSREAGSPNRKSSYTVFSFSSDPALKLNLNVFICVCVRAFMCGLFFCTMGTNYLSYSCGICY